MIDTQDEQVKFTLKVDRDKETGNHKVILTATKNVFDDFAKSVKEIFDTEMLTAEIKSNKKMKQLTITTRNDEKCDMIESAMIKMYTPKNRETLGNLDN